MVWQLLAKPLLGVVADGVKSFAETKKAKAELAVTEIKAKQKLKEDQIAGKVAWEQSAVSQMENSWKDEFWTVIFGAILLGCFLPWTQSYVKEGFIFLEESTPSWFSTCLILIISASFGIKTVKGAAGFLSKKK
tara:strand:+ start:1021 stop:1422 length:402 start_codon:yes stop_codon:yes gene_type:complete